MINEADAACHYGDHSYSGRGVVCTHCGHRNMGLLSYYSLISREAKKRGISPADYEAEAAAESADEEVRRSIGE